MVILCLSVAVAHIFVRLALLLMYKLGASSTIALLKECFVCSLVYLHLGGGNAATGAGVPSSMVPSDMKNGGGASHHILGGSGYGNTMNYKRKLSLNKKASKLVPITGVLP